jgi:hypothetical protein
MTSSSDPIRTVLNGYARYPGDNGEFAPPQRKKQTRQTPHTQGSEPQSTFQRPRAPSVPQTVPSECQARGYSRHAAGRQTTSAQSVQTAPMPSPSTYITFPSPPARAQTHPRRRWHRALQILWGKLAVAAADEVLGPSPR